MHEFFLRLQFWALTETSRVFDTTSGTQMKSNVFGLGWTKKFDMKHLNIELGSWLNVFLDSSTVHEERLTIRGGGWRNFSSKIMARTEE